MKTGQGWDRMGWGGMARNFARGGFLCGSFLRDDGRFRVRGKGGCKPETGIEVRVMHMNPKDIYSFRHGYIQS